MTQIDTALNLGWALLCIAAVVWHLWRSRETAARRRLVRIYRGVSVVLAALALFPCISASDDRVQLHDLDSGFNHSSVLDHSNRALSAQLAAIEHGQAATPLVLTLTWRSFLLLLPAEPVGQHTSCQAALSRGPPNA